MPGSNSSAPSGDSRRRTANPPRSKTPSTSFDWEDPHSETADSSNPATLAENLRRRSRPKPLKYLSNYFSSTSLAGLGDKKAPDPFSVDHFPRDNPFLETDSPVRLAHEPIEIICQCLFDQMTRNMRAPIPENMHVSIFRLIEAYRELVEECEDLRSGTTRYSSKEAADSSFSSLSAEREFYKNEIRRLEAKLAHQSNKPASYSQPSQDVTKRSMTARQQMSYRGDMVSPSFGMRKLSLSLAASGLDDVHLSSSTIPDNPHSLANVEVWSDKASITDKASATVRSEITAYNLNGEGATSKKSKSAGNDSSTISSSGGDLLDDELEDFQAVKHVASLIARNSGVSIEVVFPQLADLVRQPGWVFGGDHVIDTTNLLESVSTFQEGDGIHGGDRDVSKTKSGLTSQEDESQGYFKEISGRQSAVSSSDSSDDSGLELRTTCTRPGFEHAGRSRSFSFQLGDDHALPGSYSDLAPYAHLRGSHSGNVKTSFYEREESPIPPVGTAIAYEVQYRPRRPSELPSSHKPKIPSPMRDRSSYIQSYQEREDSNSSLVTALHRSPAPSRQVSSENKRDSIVTVVQTSSNSEPSRQNSNHNSIHRPISPATPFTQTGPASPSHAGPQGGRSHSGKNCLLATAAARVASGGSSSSWHGFQEDVANRYLSTRRSHHRKRQSPEEELR